VDVCKVLNYVNRIIRLEDLTSDDYDKDNFHDIVLMFNDKENNFVQHVDILTVNCYSKGQLDILKKMIKKQKSVTGCLHATSTGWGTETADFKNRFSQ